MKFADYIYSNPKKTQRPLNESKISDFIQDLYPFYAASKIPKTLEITRYDLTDEGEDVVDGRADIMDYANGDTLLIDFVELKSKLVTICVYYKEYEPCDITFKSNIPGITDEDLENYYKVAKKFATDNSVGKGHLAQLFDEIKYFHELYEVR